MFSLAKFVSNNKECDTEIGCEYNYRRLGIILSVE